MEAIALDASLRTLGASTLRVFPIAYGCWRFAGTSVEAAVRKIETAVEVGINLFDHADIYGGDGAAEELFGRALSTLPDLRAKIVLATKCGIIPGVPYDSTRDHIRTACEASLRRLRCDVIDLYQIHRPDVLAHPAEIAAALTQLREQGKIREVGVSNYRPAQLAALQRHLGFPIVTTQPELSPWYIEPIDDGVLDQCMERGITPLAWSPLAGGKLGLSTEQARREPDGERLAQTIEALDTLATREGVDRTAIILAFLLALPAGVIPILGTQREDRIRASLDAFRVRLSRQDWYGILTAARGKPLP